MKLQNYFPSALGDRIAWLVNFQFKLPGIAARLNFEQGTVDGAMADLAWLIYFLSEAQPWTRRQALACTALAKDLMTGKGNNPVVLPLSAMPEPPEGVAPVKPGALRRIFKLARTIKFSLGYTEDMGIDLGIVGDLYKADSPVPTFKLTVISGDDGEHVKLTYRLYGRDNVTVECLRGDGGWEDLGLHNGTTWTDKRPLLDPARPEIRQYRLRFWHGGHPASEWTAVASVTVSP